MFNSYRLHLLLVKFLFGCLKVFDYISGEVFVWFPSSFRPSLAQFFYLTVFGALFEAVFDVVCDFQACVCVFDAVSLSPRERTFST